MGGALMAQSNTAIGLRPVAGLFVLGGLYGVADAFMGVIVGDGWVLHPALWLGLAIGPGLLRHDSRWRTTGLVLLWADVILLPAVALGMLVTRESGLTFLGWHVAASLPAALSYLAALLGLSVWQLWVLTRPTVRELFGVPNPRIQRAAEGLR
jgi:hypothetical protein